MTVFICRIGRTISGSKHGNDQTNCYIALEISLVLIYLYVSFEFPINKCDAGLEGHKTITITMAETKLIQPKNGEA